MAVVTAASTFTVPLVAFAAGSYAAELDRLDRRIQRLHDEDVLGPLEIAYPTRERLVEVVAEAGVVESLEQVLDDARAASPPRRHRRAHRQLVATLQHVVSSARDGRRAAEDEDIAGIAAAGSEIGIALSGFVADAPPAYCRLIDFGFDALCGEPDGLDTEYARAVHEILAGFQVEVSGRVGFPAALDGADLYRYLELIQPEVEAALASSLADLETLAPPESLAPDHAVLLTFVRDTLGVAKAITTATLQRDDAALMRLFEDSGTVFERARSSLSDNARPMVDVLFYSAAAGSNVP